jgi:hypothetical protein
MQYPAIWHSIFGDFIFNEISDARGNLLLERRVFQQVNCADAARAMQIF